jgi:ABC-type antimicrobial peptide transport system permease subunit
MESLLALLFGGGIMLVSVIERTRKMGLSMAVGATKKAIELQFLSGTLVLSMIGGLIGILVGRASSYIVSPYFSCIFGLEPTRSAGPRWDPGRRLCAQGSNRN